MIPGIMWKLVQAWRFHRFPTGLNIGFDTILNLRTIYLHAEMRDIEKELLCGIIKINIQWVKNS